jgi:hypothetical protein
MQVEEYDRLMQEESQASLACNNAFAVVALVQALIVTVGECCKQNMAVGELRQLQGRVRL